MVLAGFHESSFSVNSQIAHELSEQQIGGVIIYSRGPGELGARAPKTRNVLNFSQLQGLTKDLSRYAKLVQRWKDGTSLPLLIAIDGEGGNIERLPEELGFGSAIPSARELGDEERRAQGDPILKRATLSKSREYAGQLAGKLAALNINLNLAPCVDLDLNSENRAISGAGRSYSLDPTIVIDQAIQFIEAHKAQGIFTTLKHFPGLGSAGGDTHLDLVDATQTYQSELELAPFKELIREGKVELIMVAHTINGALDKTTCKPGPAEDPRSWCPASMSKFMVEGLLRGKLGFSGVVISDDFSMAAIRRNFPLDVALEKALNAGVEIFIVGNHRKNETKLFVDTIASLVLKNKVPKGMIEQAFRRIAALKRGLQEPGSTEERIETRLSP